MEMSNNYEYFEKLYQPEFKWASTHFFCWCCLVHRPIDDRSPDERYCQQCCDFLLEEASMQRIKRADWIPRTGGQDTPSDGGDTQQARGDDVTKIADKGIIPTAEETGILLQGKGRGRPRKQNGEPVSRMTQWRRKREKEVHGVLL